MGALHKTRQTNKMNKNLDNTTASQAKENVSDLVIWGDGDMFKLLCKASSKAQGWMKSTKACEIEGVGCIVQVTTQQKNETNFHPLTGNDNGNGGLEVDAARPAADYSLAEAVTFVPGVKILETKNDEGVVTHRKLVTFNPAKDASEKHAPAPAKNEKPEKGRA